MDNNYYSNGSGGIWQADSGTWEKNEGNFEEHNDFLFDRNEDADETVDAERDTGSADGDCY